MAMVLELSPEAEAQLAAYCEAEAVSVDEAVRRALVWFFRRQADEAALEAVTGMWADRDIDSVEYQRKLRAEWDREWDPD